MLMLGLLLLVYQDLLASKGFIPTNLMSSWKIWLFYLGTVFFISLIPKMTREFFIFHLSENNYRNLVIDFLKTAGLPYKINVAKGRIDSEDPQKIQSWYHSSMSYSVWYSTKGIKTLLMAKKYALQQIKRMEPYPQFSWYGFFFLFISLLLMLRFFYAFIQIIS